ncbi:hypothetical protein MM236_18385 [Belliella sp. DSM 107340]|uniref:Uncharacterized protein n=1 Tax=Belliella calami TaxID=2923436 RepID=A0ABS9UU66_9BACT|nr:hypothetical protein [Belliella calami]MCH7399969.1 hypothetical protein [Belliella calami]
MKLLVLNNLLFFAIIVKISACSESGITPPPSPNEDRNPYSLGKMAVSSVLKHWQIRLMKDLL